MKAATCLLAVLLMLSCTSFAQTATTPQTAPGQEAAPTQQPTPTQQAAPVQETAPIQQAAAASSKTDADSQPSTPSTSIPSPSQAVSTPSAEAAASAGDVPAVPAVPAVSSPPVFAPGIKIFIAPMNGFELRVSDAILKKKVPVVVVSERAQADFVLSGIAHVHKRNFFTGFVLTTNGYGSVWIEDAHTGKQVFLYKFTRVDANTTVDQDYQNWADSAAKRMKKTLEPKKKKSPAGE